MFTPDVSKSVVKGKKHILKGGDDEPINYFFEILPRMIRAEGKALEGKVFEFIQYPGDTVFIPGGWWHAVLNIDDTVAVTQNFCSRVNFDKVWCATRSGRKKMAVRWLKVGLQKKSHA